MQFSCEHCGRRLKVANGQAGKKGRCPQCKNTLTVPAPSGEVTAQTSPAAGAVTATKPSLCDPRLFDVPPADTTPAPLSDEEAYQMLRAMHGGSAIGPREEPPTRPLPWVFDVFLYPLNKSGLMILLLCAGIPLVLRVLLKLSQALTFVCLAGLILWVPLILIHWVGLLLSVCYVVWYAAECIRDSADGGIRAVDSTASTPGLGELLRQTLTVFVCIAACMGPAFLYARGRDADPLSRLLYGLGGLLLPMALTAVILSESFRALNPIRLLGSAFRTLLPYCILAAFGGTIWLFPSLVIRHILSESWILAYLYLFLAFYHVLVLAHLMGRFYWRNEEKLSWDA